MNEQTAVVDIHYHFIPHVPEDIILITEDGYENLTAHLPHDLWIGK